MTQIKIAANYASLVELFKNPVQSASLSIAQISLFGGRYMPTILQLDYNSSHFNGKYFIIVVSTSFIGLRRFAAFDENGW